MTIGVNVFMSDNRESANEGTIKWALKHARGVLWTEEDLRAAVAAVKSGRMSLRAASRRHAIPYATLSGHLRSGSLVKRFGRKSVFSEEQEKELVKIIQNLTTKGMSLNSKLIRKQAFDFCLENNIGHTFNITRGTAGADWYRGFLKRHPVLNPVLERNKK